MGSWWTGRTSTGSKRAWTPVAWRLQLQRLSLVTARLRTGIQRSACSSAAMPMKAHCICMLLHNIFLRYSPPAL